MGILRSLQTTIVIIFSLGVVACGRGGFSTTPQTRSSFEKSRGIESTPGSLETGYYLGYRADSGIKYIQTKKGGTFKVRQKVQKFEPVLDPHPETAEDEVSQDWEPKKEKKREETLLPEEPISQAPPKVKNKVSRPVTPTEERESPPELPAEKHKKEAAASEIVGSGVIKPTVYYFPIVDESKITCTQRISLINKNGIPLIQVCQSTMAACALQGSCAIVQNKKIRSFNIAGYSGGTNRFFEMTHHSCKFGYGVKNSCLDPFYTVAADLKIYKPGDVIYVPAVVGLQLPNGSKHHGYFIVRDTGRAIKGKGRFDFFSGFYSWRDTENPFVKLGLASKKTQLSYYQVSGPTAEMVLKTRQFPLLPAHSIGLDK